MVPKLPFLAILLILFLLFFQYIEFAAYLKLRASEKDLAMVQQLKTWN